MKRLVVGLLAHVDSGKTTLAEGLLYRAGVLRKLGRVDHRDAFLDTDSQERARGITIFAKQAVLTLPAADGADETELTLLDTPGHVDFSAEAERALQVLDYAVLVVSGTDGVGTKLKIAMIMDKHDTIGIDCVAMCVNDVICAGAKPLVFLDYIACGRNIPEKIAEIVKGVAEGCVQADCSLVGGETAEHPGMMPEEEYDLAGFTVGVVDKEKILSNETMAAGDVILALPSTGVHSNGFSLVRKIFDIDANPDVLHTAPAELGGKTLGEALLAPTKIYVKPVLKVLEEVDVKGISHITGGGFYENIPRSLKKGCCARINKADVRTPALFQLMQKTGNISEHDMFNTFNMGVGMVLTVPAEQADKALDILHANGEPEAYRLGVIAEGEGVELC